MDTKVSFFIAAFNAQNYILEAVDSALNQTYENIEIIIVNDGSTDNTLSILENEYHLNDKVKIYSNSINLGIAKTRNRALTLCTGQYIAILDADDIATPSRIELQLGTLKKNNADICIGNVHFFGNGENRTWKAINNSDELKKLMAFNCPISNSSVLIKKSILIEMHGYDINSITEDYNLWVRTLEKKYKYVAVDYIVVNSREHQASYTKSKRALVLNSAANDRKLAINYYFPEFNSYQVEILTKSLSGTNHLTLKEFKLFIFMNILMQEKLKFREHESIVFLSHNWISVGINNINLGVFGYLYWLKNKELCRKIKIKIKIKLFIAFLLKLNPGSKTYIFLKSIGKKI